MDYEPICSQILDVSLGVHPRDRVWIDGWDHTTEFITHLVRECEKRKCRVLTTIRSEASWLRSVKRGRTTALERLSPMQSRILEETNCYIFTLGPRHPIDWGRIPPARRRLATIWLLEQNRFAKQWRSIAARRGVKMLGIEATLATRERARSLGINFANYSKLMYSGCLADSRQMSSLAKRFSKVLGQSTVCRITTPQGTDLKFAIDNRPVETSDGLVSEEKVREGRPVFLPAGSVGTTVVEDSAEGTIQYDQPVRSWKGIIQKLKLSVAGGRVVRYSGRGKVEIFKEFLEENPGNAGRFAFVGSGLNPLLKPGNTQDDKVLGSIELNFGENKSRGGKNRGIGGFWGTVSNASVIMGTRQIMKSGKLIV